MFMTTIFITTHKNVSLPQDTIHKPLQVGYREDFGYLRDNTGNNIAYRNLNYAELTGLYWVWKNYTDDIIGHYQYRRFLDIHPLAIPELLEEYEILTCKPILLAEQSIEKQFTITHGKENWEIFTKELVKQEYDITLFKEEKQMYYSNLFVMKQKTFHHYMNWLFTIIDRLKVQVNAPVIPYQCFIYSFFAERLFNLYLKHFDISYKEFPVLFNPNIKEKYEA